MKRLGPLVGVFVLLGGASAASAQPAAVQIWYRSAAGCPEGSVFVSRLAALGRHAQLASAGDRVDFVVTLDGPGPAAASPQSLGRLERQTERGTVAIRELRAPRCEDVAEALALSLELALQPVADNTAASGPSEAASPSGPSMAEAPGAEPLPGAADRSSESDAGTPPASDERAASPGLRLGLQATLTTGVGPAALPGLAVFAALARESPGPSARVALRGGYQERELARSSTELGIALMAGRLEGCPWSWAFGRFALEPCFGLEVGVLRAEARGDRGRSDSGVWVAGVGHVRLAWRVAQALSLEAELGALVPFVRYDLGPDADSSSLFRTEPVGLAGALGAAWHLP